MNNKKRYLRKYDIFQFLIILALIAFMVVMVNSRKNKTASMTDIKTAMQAYPSVTALTEKTLNDAANNLSFDASLVEEGLYYRVDDIMNVNELLIVRISDDEKRALALEAINKYLEEKKDSFEGYGTDQFGLLSNAILTEKGEYLFFGVSPEVLSWESTFEECFR